MDSEFAKGLCSNCNKEYNATKSITHIPNDKLIIEWTIFCWACKKYTLLSRTEIKYEEYKIQKGKRNKNNELNLTVFYPK